MTTKICSKCKCEKSVEDFSKQAIGKNGLRADCKVCKNIYDDNYIKSLKGYLKKLLIGAKNHAKVRLSNGRIEAGVFELTFEDIEALWKNQDGKCYYSSIQMNHDKNEWKVSLERLNTDLGYIKSNVVLCCREFNDAVQWTIEKIINMLQLLKLENPVEEQDFELIKKIIKKREKVVKTMINNIDHFNCTHCYQIKSRDEFPKTISDGCKKCRTIYEKERNDIPRRVLQQLLNYSKKNTKERKEKDNEKRDNTHDIDLEFLIELYKKQKGLCAYSKLPLKFKCNEDWKISLERKDVFNGYVKTNICLICKEFNTFDQSVVYKKNDSGSSGWNEEKFNLFVKYASEKYNI
jgi:hypothetical protein